MNISIFFFRNQYLADNNVETFLILSRKEPVADNNVVIDK